MPPSPPFPPPSLQLFGTWLCSVQYAVTNRCPSAVSSVYATLTMLPPHPTPPFPSPHLPFTAASWHPPV